MNENQHSPQSPLHQMSNLAQEPEGASTGSLAAVPPPFQLQASSLSDLVSPVAAMAAGPLQMKKLSDYNDKDPKHDPSHVSDSLIKGTDEHTYLLHNHYLIPTTDPSILYSPDEILLACRLMLRSMREGNTVDVAKQGRAFLDRARSQSGTADKAESLNNQLSWQNTYPGNSNTDFGDWLLNSGAEPKATTGVMNCWEMVMFSAYKAGYATKSGLASMYKQFAKDLSGSSPDIPKAVTNFENALRQGKEQVYDPTNADSPKPLRGDIVIFNTLASHVAIATGTTTGKGEVGIMSLWTQNSKKVYKTSVEELLKSTNGPVRFFSPSW